MQEGEQRSGKKGLESEADPGTAGSEAPGAPREPAADHPGDGDRSSGCRRISVRELRYCAAGGLVLLLALWLYHAGQSPELVTLLEATVEKIEVGVDSAQLTSIPLLCATLEQEGAAPRRIEQGLLELFEKSRWMLVAPPGLPLFLRVSAPPDRASPGSLSTPQGPPERLGSPVAVWIDPGCEAPNRLRFPVHGAVELGEELKPGVLSEDRLRAAAPYLLREGRLETFARFDFFGSHTVAGLGSLRLMPAARMKAENRDGERISWWGYVEPAGGALRVSISTTGRGLRVLSESAVALSDDTVSAGLFMRMTRDPFLVLWEALFAVALALFTVLDALGQDLKP